MRADRRGWGFLVEMAFGPVARRAINAFLIVELWSYLLSCMVCMAMNVVQLADGVSASGAVALAATLGLALTFVEATAQAAEAHPAPPASAASSPGSGPSASSRGRGSTPGGASPRGQQHEDDAACGTGGGSGVAGDGLPSPPPAAQGP